MRREVPLLICFLAGFFFISDFFIPETHWTEIAHTFNRWAIIVIAFAYVLGAANIVRVNSQVIRRRERDWQYKVVLLSGLALMIILGIGFGIKEGTTFNWVFMNAIYPMQATMFSLLAFYIASAAFRAFRIRTWEAALLGITAVLVMIGRVPIGEFLWNSFPDLVEWIMNVPQLAAKRAIMIGAALGAISTGLKVLVGLERTYMGGE
ncbi:MAG: hypothetical protein AMJ90_05655 [candidate division Zixibacteria bacterium SM23_73_2]|nr:MAG: hypothetical protein AMJ90_05655 [candidate division Zixibacteria bacterium SM23_73_2]